MYPKSVFPVTYVVLNSPYDWFRLIFEEEKILNLKILCYLSYKCHHCYLRDPCKASLSSYGFIELFHHKNKDNINILCLMSTL